LGEKIGKWKEKTGYNVKEKGKRGKKKSKWDVKG
jgi:hypothetical protein